MSEFPDIERCIKEICLPYTQERATAQLAAVIAQRDEARAALRAYASWTLEGQTGHRKFEFESREKAEMYKAYFHEDLYAVVPSNEAARILEQAVVLKGSGEHHG